jgi:RNA polymerase sigma factor (sigma-70 family)
MVALMPQAVVSFDDLVAECYPRVRSYARRQYKYEVEHIEVEDLVQEAMLRAVEQKEAILQATSPEAYFMVVARHAIITYCIRKGMGSVIHYDARFTRGSLYEICSLDVPEHGAYSPLLDVLPSQKPSEDLRDYSALYAALDRLSQKQRYALGVHFGLPGYGDGKSDGAASREEGIRHSSFQYRIRNGVKALRCDLELCMALDAMIAAGQGDEEYRFGGAA